MASKITYASSIVPFSGANINLNGTTIIAGVPTEGQILVGDGAGNAQWANSTSISNNIEFLLNSSNINLPNSRTLIAGGGVTKSLPASDVEISLTATGVTPATYVNPILSCNNVGEITTASTGSDTLNKPVCRVATIEAGTLASDFSAGDTIDGVVLALGDRILIKNQASAIENGIYVVTAGAPTRADDLGAGADANGIFVSINEGTINNGQVFMCISPSGSDVVGTDTLTFRQLWGNKSIAIEVGSTGEFINAINGGFTNIILGPSQYDITTSINISNDTFIKGYGFASVVRFISSNGSLFNISSSINVSFENIRFITTGTNSYIFNVFGGGNLSIKECDFEGRGFIQTSGGLINAIDTCILNTIALGTSSTIPLSFDNTSRILIKNTIITGDLNDTTISFTNGCQNVIMSSCQTEDTEIVLANSSDITIDSCINTEGFLSIDTCENVNIINNNFSLITPPTQTSIVQISSSDKTRVSGNSFSSFSLNEAVLCDTSPNSIIRGNTFNCPSNTFDINIDDNSNNSLVEGNSSAQSILVSVSAVGNTNVNVARNNNNLTITNPTSIGAYYDAVLIDKTIDPLPVDPFPLEDPTRGSAQRVIYILANSDSSGGGSPLYTMTYTNLTFSSITFNNVADYVILQWTGTEWVTINNSGVTFNV